MWTTSIVRMFVRIIGELVALIGREIGDQWSFANAGNWEHTNDGYPKMYYFGRLPEARFTGNIICILN